MTPEQIKEFLYPSNKIMYSIIATGEDNVKYISMLYYPKETKPLEALESFLKARNNIKMILPYRIYKGSIGADERLHKHKLIMEIIK